MVATAASPEYRYDGNGNTVLGGGRQIAWTSYDMVGRIEAGPRRLDYLYDSSHQRIYETYSLAGVVQRKTFYIGDGRSSSYEEVTGANEQVQTRTHYIQAGGATVATIVCTALPCTQPNNTTTNYWHADRLGSVSAITDASGAVVERLAYEPFGKRRAAGGAKDTAGTLAGANTRWGFTEQEHIDEIGLINMNGRVYDPALSRFISPDPHVTHENFTQSFNRYSYVFNNPINVVDPTGFDREPTSSEVEVSPPAPPATGGDSGSAASGGVMLGRAAL